MYNVILRTKSIILGYLFAPVSGLFGAEFFGHLTSEDYFCYLMHKNTSFIHM